MKKKENHDLSSPTGGQGAGCYPLPEGSFTIDKTKVFVPFDESKDVLNERPTGSLLVQIQPFLLVTSKDILLLDTGLGYNNSEGKLQVHENIRAAGYRPEEVTKVLLTHLHKDHAGGIGNSHPGTFSGGDVLNFPAAKYYLQRRELDYAWHTGAPSFTPDEIEPLLGSDQVRFLHDDEGVIDDYIFYKHTGGHSLHHQAFWIKDGGETFFFGGDVAPQLQQMKIRYKTKYDVDPDRAMDLRSQWWKQGAKEGWTFLFYHDIKTPLYKG